MSTAGQQPSNVSQGLHELVIYDSEGYYNYSSGFGLDAFQSPQKNTSSASINNVTTTGKESYKVGYSRLNLSQFAGIIVGIVIGCLLIIASIACLVYKRGRRKIHARQVGTGSAYEKPELATDRMNSEVTAIKQPTQQHNQILRAALAINPQKPAELGGDHPRRPSSDTLDCLLSYYADRGASSDVYSGT